MSIKNPKKPDDLFPKGVTVQPEFRKFVHQHWNEIDIDVHSAITADLKREDISDVLFRIPQLAPYVERFQDHSCQPADSGLLQIPKQLDRVAGYQYIDLPKGHEMYKGMESYVTLEEEQAFFKRQTDTHPAWLGSKFLAIRFAVIKNGGVHAYRLKHASKFLVWNDTNIVQMYKLLCGFEKSKKGIYSVLKKAFEIGIGIGVSAYDRARYIQYLNNESKIVMFPYVQNSSYYCDSLYPDLTYYYNKFYLHRFLFKYWILPVVQQIGIQGVYSPQHYNPWQFPNAIWIQEYVVADQARFLERHTVNPVDWQSYKDKLDFKMPTDGFVISVLNGARNRNHRMMKWYLDNRNAPMPPLPKPKDATTIMTINVRRFEQIKLNNTTVDEAIVGLFKTADRCKADIVVAHEVNFDHITQIEKQMHQYGYLSHSKLPGPLTSIVVSKLPTMYDNPMRISKGNADIRFPRYCVAFQVFGTRYTATQLSVGVSEWGKPEHELATIRDNNSSYRIGELDTIIGRTAPDVIVGDLGFLPHSTEFKHLVKSGYTTSVMKHTTVMDTTVDYVWVRTHTKHSCCTVPYCYSDHLPVVATLYRGTSGGAPAQKTYTVKPPMDTETLSTLLKEYEICEKQYFNSYIKRNTPDLADITSEIKQALHNE